MQQLTYSADSTMQCFSSYFQLQFFVYVSFFRTSSLFETGGAGKSDDADADRHGEIIR